MSSPTSKFQIELSIDSTKTEIYTTIESFITYFIYSYLNCPKNIELKFIECNDNDLIVKSQEKQQNKFCIRLNNLNLINKNEFINIENLKNTNISRLPIYETDNNLYIFGVCAISRALVIKSENHDELLGFKKNCLMATSERSIWTKLCELDMIIALQEILNCYSKQQQQEEEEGGEVGGKGEEKNNDIRIPDYFTIFEYHMNQPTKAHNFYKILREEIQKNHKKNSIKTLTTLEHNFAEGYFFSLVDVILYPCINFLLLTINENDKFNKYFPLTLKWLKRVENYDKNLQKTLLKILDIDYYKMKIQQLHLNFLINNDNIKIHSLYRNDIKNQQYKEYTNQLQIDESLNKIKKLNLIIESHKTIPTDIKFEWEQIQNLARPEFSGLPKERLQRKKDQLKNLVNSVINIAKPNDIIVDFCSGTGHLGIILAELLPNCHIIFLENKFFSIIKSIERAKILNLNNCSFYQCNIDYFDKKFNIGVSLHACGTATDIVLLKCIKSNANFICCPCCYGSITPMPHIKYPLSKKFNNLLNENDFLYISHAADQSHDINVKNCNLEKRKQGEYCMDCIDTDRKLYAEENNYIVKLKKLYPEDCTPKNRLLIGVIKNHKEKEEEEKDK